MNSQRLVYLNGAFQPESEARVSIFDRGFLYGDGVFETMRSYGGRIFRLAEHLARLTQSASVIKLELTRRPEELAGICNELLSRNQLSDGILRLSVSRGPSVGGIGTARAAEPTVVAFVRPPMPMPDGAYEQGVSTRTVPTIRIPSAAIDSRIKSMNFLNYILARSEAEQAGAYEAIMFNSAGYIAETSTSNIFFAHDDILTTPSLDCDILPGITRKATLELAEILGIRYEEKRIRPSEISDADECFITNSSVELLPVTTIDENSVGNGQPGAIYSRLHTAYRDLVLED